MRAQQTATPMQLHGQTDMSGFAGSADALVTSLLASNTSLRAFAEGWLRENQIHDWKALHSVNGGVNVFLSLLQGQLPEKSGSVHTQRQLVPYDVGAPPPSTNGSSSGSPMRAQVSVLFYDDRYNASRDRGTLTVYRSLDHHKVPFSVGPPITAYSSGSVARSDGAPGDGPTMKGNLHYRPGDKVEWLMRTLPTVTSELVYILDTDIIWLCSPEEVKQKRAALLRDLAAPPHSVVLFGERSMWPPHQQYRGTHLRLNGTDGYPPANKSQPFRYINAGAALGTPRDLLALHECMQKRYAEFPHACPAGHTPSGELRYYSPKRNWQPPVLDRPLHSRDLKYHGLRLKGSNWGWEQGCFHMYYLEQLNGELPDACPPIVLDRAGQIMLHIAGNSPRSFEWVATNSSRAIFKATNQRPCIMHANGPSKKALKPIWHWWEDPLKSPKPSWH